MNNIIRDLNSKAYAACKKHEDGTMVLTDEWTERFAKLVASECASIYEKIDNGNAHLGTHDYLEAIKKHFWS